MANSELQGVWELESDTHEGVLILTESHFSELITQKDRGQFSTDRPSKDESKDLLTRLSQAKSGTFTAELGEGTELCLWSKEPSAVGHTVRFGYNVEGDICKFWPTRSDGTPGTVVKFRRIE